MHTLTVLIMRITAVSLSETQGQRPKLNITELRKLCEMMAQRDQASRSATD